MWAGRTLLHQQLGVWKRMSGQSECLKTSALVRLGGRAVRMVEKDIGQTSDVEVRVIYAATARAVVMNGLCCVVLFFCDAALGGRC